MTTTEREERIAELAAMMQEWGMTRRETLLEILYMVYEVEFPIECLEKEFEPMSDDELMEAYLGFTPTMNYNAKAAYGIKGLIKVPELKDGEPNDFLTRLFFQVKANIAAEKAALQPQQEQYEETMAAGRLAIEAIEKPEDVSEAMSAIKGLTHALTSERELKAALFERLKALGIVYSKESKTYEWAKQ